MGRLLVFLAAGLIFLGAHARAQEAFEASVPETPVALPLDPATVENFVDGVVEAYRREKGIAGVTVSVVGRDGVLMQKGYGLSALGPVRAVDPDKTLFRIASISKTFTYTMAMQLVAEGELRLDAPADDYLADGLKFAGDGYPVPKLLDLMQHTAGFEDSAIGHLFSRQKGPALEDYLKTYRPKRVRAPGTASIYSNYSVALLGYIIARIDGRSFEDSVEARILKPLGIQGISFREPPDNPDSGLFSSFGFKRDAGWFAPQAFFYAGQVGPAGAASATASGMARYMRMLLNGGSLDGVEILLPETFAIMNAESFRNAPEANAVAHGFLTGQNGGLRSIGHDGAAIFFYSNMALWPDAGLGIFVAVNTDTGYPLTAALPRLFIEHFVPTARPSEPKPTDIPADLQADMTGSYVIERRNSSTFEGFLQRIIDTTAIAVRDDGTVVLSNADQATRLVMESPDVLRAVESGNRVRLERGETGAISGFASPSGVNEARKLGILDTPMVFGSVIAALMVGSVWSVIAFLVRLRYFAGRGQTIGERLSSATQIVTALLWLAAFVSLTMAALPMFQDDVAVMDYPGTSMPVARMLLHAAAAASLATFVMVAPAWRGATWRLRRLTYTAYALLAVTATLLLWRWGALLTPIMLGA